MVGDRSLVNFVAPVIIGLAAPAHAVQVAAAYHSLVLDASGRLSGAGNNVYGQIGIGDPFSRRIFCKSLDAGPWDRVWAGPMDTFARKTDGSLWACGAGSFGRLGTGSSSADVLSFIQVGSDLDWAEVATGNNFTIFLKSSGSLWSTGLGTSGELGLGNIVSKNVPTQIGTANDWKGITSGISHSLAIKTDGTLWAWGINSQGRLGDGTTTNRTAPVQIGALGGWKLTSAGESHSCAIREDGSLWAWGNNNNGQLGDGTTTGSPTPVRIGTDNDWLTVNSGSAHSLALKTNGTLWVWGWNGDGQLGLGDTNSRTFPVRLGLESDWQSVEGGTNHSVAVKADGTVWIWGDNTSQKLGVPGPDRTTPVMATLDDRPDLSVSTATYPTGDSSLADNDRGTFSFARTAEGSPLTSSFRLFNHGSATLLVSELRTDPGFSAGMTAPFSIEAGASIQLPVTLTTTLTGDVTGRLTIVSNDADEGEFRVNLAGPVLSHLDDTDLDGLDDAAEWKMSQFGFRWDSSNPSLVAALKNEAHRAGLYTETQLRDRVPGRPLFKRDPVSGRASLVLRLEQSSDLAGFLGSDVSGASINAAGQLLVPLPRTANQGFFRFAIEASPVTP